VSSNSTTVLVDDHLLLQVLLGDESPSLREPGTTLATTGIWYHRLCRAVSASSVTGAMSATLGKVDHATAAAVVGSLIELPEHVRLLPLRQLAWPMSQLLQQGFRLNLLGLEAIAAAQKLDAKICISPINVNPTLIAAAATLSIPTRIVP
jgi:hypothetical protein